MFHDTVECPYCEFENDMSDGTTDLPSDNKFDWECEECGREFEVYVEFYPLYSGAKIEYANCENCGNETRDLVKKRTIYPYPENLKVTTICRPCYYMAMTEEYKERRQENSKGDT